jgi:hypothetical protein
VSPFSIDYPPGATPLDPNELDGLIPDYITTQAELNALERENITEATTWSEGRQHSDILRDVCSRRSQADAESRLEVGWKAENVEQEPWGV